jgi:peptidoglycan/xylan/chitin deacetylase (PgdA/CDA1 family)
MSAAVRGRFAGGRGHHSKAMTRVYITIDTECSIGGALRHPELEPVGPERAVLGEIGGRQYGIPLIMDVLEQHSLRGTFFVEVLASRVVDAEKLGSAYREIVSRGHDAQLHLHPAYDCYRRVREGSLDRSRVNGAADLIGKYPAAIQLELLREGCRLFRGMLGRDPVAFRAGCFGANAATLEALSELGIRYDSSFNGAYCGTTCLMSSPVRVNTPWLRSRVWEVPVTNFETGLWRRRLKPCDVGAVSLMEMKRVLNQAHRLGIEAVVITMHSFTLFKVHDVQFRKLRPDNLVIRRFRGLCRFLARHRHRFEIATFGSLPSFPIGCADPVPPRMGAVLPLCRKVVQGINRAYWM